MKLPSCLAGCFGGCARSHSETESSHFSVGKDPGPSCTVLSGFLNSFMSRRSCSRGTWDYGGTDTQKPHARARGDGDVVTLATARYIELFAASPKNDETSTVLSEMRGAQDSIRSARTASEIQVSRSSTFTGRASREPSRLAGNNQPQLTPLASLPASSSQRVPTLCHRRGASDALVTSISSGKDWPPFPPQAQPGLAPPQHSRRTGSMPHVSSQSPFTNKTRMPMLDNSRARSDRMSPSTAAYLLPAPSARAISRAHTALPIIAARSGAVPSSTSLNDLSQAPVESSFGDSGGLISATVRPQDPPSAAATTASGGRGRRPRLQTESGSTAACAPTMPASPPSPLDLASAAQPWFQGQNQFTMSSTPAQRTGTVRRPLPRRPSILFTRDGDVTVTGLPPSCLTAGRAPRGRLDMPGSMICTGAGSTAVIDASAPILCSALFRGGGSVDSASSQTGGLGGGVAFSGSRNSCVHEPITFTMLSRSIDRSTSRCTNASNVGLSVSNLRQHHRRRVGVGGGKALPGAGVSMSCGTNTVFMTAEGILHDCPTGGCTMEAQLGGFLEEEEKQPRQQLQKQQQGQQQQQQNSKGIQKLQEQQQDEGKREQKRSEQGPSPGGLNQGPQEDNNCQDGAHVNASQALAIANSSSEGRQRCDWGGSSMYAPSRFSDSSRLTHGNMTGAVTVTASMHSNNPLYTGNYRRILEPCTVGGTTADAFSSPAGTPGCLTSAVFSMTAGLAPAAPLVGADAAGSSPPVPPQAEPMKPYGADVGQSLLATEARDVTSALNRLQEACLAAVAQGDMRSQRLWLRTSTEVPRTGVDPSQRLARIGGGDRGSNMALIRMAPSLSFAAAGTAGTATARASRTAGIRTGPCCGPSTSLISLVPESSPRASPAAQDCGDDHMSRRVTQAGSVNVSVTLAAALRLKGEDPVGVNFTDCPEAGGFWCNAGFGVERTSPDGEGIVLDGEILRKRFSTAPDGDEGRDGDIAEGDGGCGRYIVQPCPLFNDTHGFSSEIEGLQADGSMGIYNDVGNEYRNRVLNVLLRSEFLYETHDAASDDDDDDEEEGVLEYRYGGFELGGGDHECGFTRQASFMEAVRKCGIPKAAVCAVGLDASQPGVPVSEVASMFQSATLAAVATGSRTGPSTAAALHRKGSCLAPAAAAHPGSV
ncbi:hypothetical protein VaNZ11_013119 [Volvox africanus]|uniref:Uncharacterized protein n=1 Tax=Volvox africanus TaxID=51714 RepID=A0ABQ5SGS2_9CHLO|nr:hypothetical protein VaNZ11_013119 [Volvox africanus]